MTPPQLRALQRRITRDPEAVGRIRDYLDSEGIEHSGRMSGGTLARACGVHPRTWRKWVGGEQAISEPAMRLLHMISGV